MSRFWMLAVACAAGLTLTATPANADDSKQPAKKGDPTEIILTILEQEVQLKEGANINEIPLSELLHDLSKRHQLNFAINEIAFKQVGQPNIKEEKPNIAATQLRGLPMRQFLNLTLDGMGATYLVKGNVIEIVPIQHAAKVTKSTFSQDDDGPARLREPLVSAIFKEKPLNEAVAELAKMYDLTVVVSPQAGDAKTGFVNARLLNQPADKAIELLALQCDLRVVRRGTAYILTSRDHANDLFGEKLDKERQLIELEQLRKGIPKPPEKAPEKPADKPPVFGLQFKGVFPAGIGPNTFNLPFSGSYPLPGVPGMTFGGFPPAPGK